MNTEEPDSILESLDNQSLRSRLVRRDWKIDPLYVRNEQVFRMYRNAREKGEKVRVGLLSEALSRRLLGLGKGFAVRSGIYPINIGNLDQAAEEIAQFVWECLITRPKDMKHAEKAFGQLFKRRALDFQRRLLSKKRKCQDSLDAMDKTLDEDDPERVIREELALQDSKSPDEALDSQREHAQVAARLQIILTKEEHFVYVMIFVNGMKIKDIAEVMDVHVRTVNNYKRAAIEKVQKEFKK